MDLTKIDYEILEYAVTKNTFTETELDEFTQEKIQGLHQRLGQLVDIHMPDELNCEEKWSYFYQHPSYLKKFYYSQEDTEANYQITDMGKAALQNYKTSEKEKKKKKREERIFKIIPLVLSSISLLISISVAIFK